MKKLILVLGFISTIGFVGCGGGSSDEAKELLQKILQFVGIPQEIVVNVCQDSNRDGICGGGELFTKVTINKGDSVDNILEKISLTDDGRYFLETYNPKLPILVELQDSKVNYDEGKFTLAFNGFTTQKDDNETKEVSILESMIDANALTKGVADKFRRLTNTEAQKKYYIALLDSLERNINTLRGKGLDSQIAVAASIKEMGDETTANQDKANSINECGSDQVCVDNEIKKLSDELLITEEEAIEIKKEQESSNQSNQGDSDKIDMSKYLPSSSITKTYSNYSKTDGQEAQTITISENITVNGNTLTYTYEDNSDTTSTTINTDTITTTHLNNKIATNKRYVGIGDIAMVYPLDYQYEQNGMKVVSRGNFTCKLKSKVDSFESKSYAYSGDLLVLNCTTDVVSTTTTEDKTVRAETHGTDIEYIQTGIGLVASIEDICNKSDITSEVCTHIEEYYIK